MAIALVLGVVSACGSTVQVAGEDELIRGDELGLGQENAASEGLGAAGDASAGPAKPAEPGDPSAGPAKPGEADDATDGPAGQSGSRGSSAAPRAVGSGEGPAGSAPGVSGKTIKIGLYTDRTWSQFASSAGWSSSAGDQRVQAKAVIDYINGKGGVAGRKIVPVYHDFNYAHANNPNPEYQAACSTWTEDERVYAVASPLGTLNDNLYACLAKKGVITSSTAEIKDARFFEQYADYFYQPNGINLTRTLRDNVNALRSGGYFGKWDIVNGRSGSLPVKIGVIREDTAVDQRAVNEGLKPALAARGLSVAEEFAAPAGITGANAYSSAVLRFKQQNVTHVLFSRPGGPLFFSQNAENQQYRPRYGLQSGNFPGSFLQDNVSPGQLRGSMAMGWNQYTDVGSRHDPGPPSDRAALCLKLMKQAGEKTNNRLTAQSGMYLCDSIFFIRDALKRAPNFTPAGFRAGAEALSSYEAASTFRSGFARGKLHDAAKAYRLFAFKNSCECFAYTTSVRRAP